MKMRFEGGVQGAGARLSRTVAGVVHPNLDSASVSDANRAWMISRRGSILIPSHDTCVAADCSSDECIFLR